MGSMTSSAKLWDVSFAGASVTIGGHRINEFMDDANPIEFQDVEVSTVGVNCNGIMVRNAKPVAAVCSVTVIPGGTDDQALRKMMIEYHVQNANNAASTWTKNLTCNITTKGGQSKSYTLSGGTFLSGPGGPGANGQGKMGGRTYRFAFASINS